MPGVVQDSGDTKSTKMRCLPSRNLWSSVYIFVNYQLQFSVRKPLKLLHFESVSQENECLSLVVTETSGKPCKTKPGRSFANQEGRLSIKTAPGLGRSPAAFGLSTTGFYVASLTVFNKHLFFFKRHSVAYLLNIH